MKIHFFNAKMGRGLQQQRPRFASKLALSPIHIPHQNKDSGDVFLLSPTDNEDEVVDMGLVFPGEVISARQRLATRVSLPDQEVIETGQLMYLDRPDPDDDDEERVISTPYFLSGSDLMGLVRRERSKLLHRFSMGSDEGARLQERGDWEGAQKQYAKAIELADQHKPPSKPAFEKESIYIPSPSSASVHYQLAKVMWMQHNYHWLMLSSMEVAVKKDEKNPKYRAFQELFRYPFNEDMHATARQDTDFLAAITAFAKNRSIESLAHVNKALERLPDDVVMKAFKGFLEAHEITPEFDF